MSGMFDKMKEKAGDLMGEHGDKVDQAQEKVSEWGGQSDQGQESGQGEGQGQGEEGNQDQGQGQGEQR